MSQPEPGRPAAALSGLGERAPDFELRDQHGQDVRLSSYRGARKVLLVFYPYAFTNTCTGELAELQQNLDAFHERGVELLGVSVDSMYSQRVFAEREGITFPMLADFWPHGAVAETYGVFQSQTGVALRGSFLIDADGLLRRTFVSGMDQARSTAEYLQAVTEL